MEYAINQLIKSLINPANIIIFILLILVTVFYKKIRGFMGEFWVKQELKKLPKYKYIILNDIMIKSSKGTHQIDHIIISIYGIFVVEMKNYYGLITGEEHQNKWIQHLGKNKYYFNNPIHQNYGHIKALEELLNFSEDKFISIICISNQAKIKVKAKNVTQLDFVNDLIKSYNNEIIIEDLSKIKNKIEQNNITDKEIRKSHIKNIKNTVKENNDKEKNMICPKCGGNLVERKGKYGKFIGCSDFPNCKYTSKNI
ncbi:MAG: NERD domain-containing protein [Clostridia bacterium]|nr:NERD domain-containing protein [Clostridia bacterium]